MNVRRLLIALAALVMVLSACTPSSPVDQDDASSSAADAAALSSAPRPESANDVGPDAPSAAALAANPNCVPVGKKVARGRDAVDRLGAKLDTVAQRVGMTSAKLRKTILEDPAARVDECGALYYEDPIPPEAPGASPEVESAVLPYSSTFTLHSRPGALRTIYLDFDGSRLEGTAWNSNFNNGAAWDLLPYDTDGNGSSFSNAERDIIQDVWRRVSEDYAPFDIDVTTEDPGFDAIDRTSDDDTRYGTRAVITDDAVIASACGCGGKAYLGVYDGWPGSYHSLYQPALVFANGLNGGTSSKSIAEATSHEVGHNLGLNHDGTSAQGYYEGAGAWAPIMGVGYDRPLVQFSKGEYSDANNSEDDFSVIAANGGTPRGDDHSDVRTSATALSSLPAGIEAEISSAADVDWFSFTSAGGSVTLAATPAVLSPNLDVKLSLYNSAGVHIATADPPSAFVNEDSASGIAASLTSVTAAGTYYVQVDGVGSGNVATTGYSDYGSTGRYSLSVATNAAPVIATTSLPPTVVGQPYSQILTAAGGTGARTWTLESGALPAGLSLASTGTISGTPSSNATATFTLRVTDGASLYSTRAFTVVAGVRITSQNLPEATTGTAYSATLTGAGGTVPYTWSITSGSLPTGLSLSGNVISGTTSVTGTRVLTIQMTDSAARTVSSVITLTVSAPLSFSNQAMTSGNVGTAYSGSLSASGGRPSYVWTLESGSLPAGTVLNSNGTVTGTPTAAGTSTFTARVTDRWARTLTAVITLVIHPPIPTVTALSPASGSTLGGTSVTITGTNLTGATAVSFGGTAAASFTVNSGTSITAVSPPRVAGQVDVTVTTAGGTTATSAGSKFTYVAPVPTLTTLSPVSGPTSGGTSVTITGTGLTGATGVSFGGTAATGVTVVNSTTVTAVSPARSAGQIDVTVTTAGGTTATSAGSKFTYVSLPVVSGISPSSGPIAGGTTVTITGSNLTGATGVSFGGTAATGVTVVNATTVTAVSPARSAGQVDVRVTTPGGQSAVNANDKFTYMGVPTVTAVSPTSGSTAGGTTVTITGSNLTGATAVSFGGVGAASFTVNSGTSITAVTSTGAAGQVDVRVTTPGGQSAVTAASKFTFVVPAPTLVGLTPTSGSTLGGTAVTITGTNLTGATGVSFGGTAATSFAVVNATTVTAVSPVHSAGQVDVAVTTPGGTTSVSANSKFTFVVPAPTLVSVSPVSGSTLGGTSVTITGTDLTGATAVSFGGTAAVSFTVNSGTSITAVSPAHAAGQVDVSVTTPGGTTSVSANSKFTFVVNAPTLTSLSPVSGSTTGGTTVTITGTDLDDASAVSFGGTPAVSFTVVNATTVTAVSPAHAAGQVDVSVTTPGGTTSVSANSKFTFVVPAPTLVSVSPASGSTLGGTSVTISGTNLTGATGVSFGGTPAVSFTVNSGTSITAVSPAHAAGQVDVAVTTPGGTTSVSANSKFTFVVPAPTLTAVSPTSGSTLGGTSVTITGTDLTGATGVSFGGTAAVSFTVNSGTSITAVSPAHAAGQVDVSVTTPGGTTSVSANSKFTFVVNAPTLTSLSPVSGSTTGGTTVTITGTDLDDASAVSFGGTPAASFTVVNSTTVTAVSPVHAAGQVDVSVTTPGGTTSVSANSKFTFVVPAPTLVSLSPASGSTLGGTSVTITGTDLTGATGVSFGGTAAASFTVNSGTSITAVSPAHAAGQVDVSVTTPGGTTSVSSNSKFTFVVPAPTLTALSPTSGSTLGGTTVTITGTDLNDASAVSFGGTPAASFAVVNSTTVTAVSPAHAAGQVDVSVTTPGGTTSVSANSKFTFVVNAPTLTSLSPVSGSTLGGTSVTITGTDLTGSTGVSFGGTAAVSFTVNSGTSITAVSPAHAAGQVDVAVTTPGGTTSVSANSKFTFVVPAPTLVSVSPTSGSTLGGTTVTITGTNLTGATGVSFGGTPAASFAVVNSTTVTAVSPAHSAGQVDVTVTTPGGTTAASAASKFTFVANAPALTALSPTSGSTLGGTTVTITGTDLNDASAVSFGGTPAPSFAVLNSTTLTAVSPVHSAGQVDVAVTTPGGTTSVSAASKFTFVVNAPTLTSLSPVSGSTLGGTSVTITGTDLTGATGVSFGGTAAVSFTVNSGTSITAVSPAHVAGQVDVAVTTPGGTTSVSAASKFTFVTPAPGGLNGIVTTTSGALRGAQVRVYPVTGATPIAVAVSASDGTWSVSLPTGTYEVQVVPPSGRHLRSWIGGAARAAATDFVVSSGATGTGTTLLSVR